MPGQIVQRGLLIVGLIWSWPAAAESRVSPCPDYVVDHYRKTYTSANQCWAGEQRMKGASEACCNAAFGGGAFDCNRARAQQNIEWVFTDNGARLTYFRHRRGGATPIEAVLSAQGHNPSAKAAIEGCGSFSAEYALSKDAALRNRGDVPAGCEDAKINADWVLFRDNAARLVYEARRNAGTPPFEALLFAQAHNPSAQGHLRLCRRWVEHYLDENP